MAGLTPIFDEAQIQRMMDRFQGRAEDKIVKILQRAGERGVSQARSSGKYNDITGNLRSSIGYAVVKDGSEIFSDFQPAQNGTDKDTGISEAKRLVSGVAKSHNKGYVLILVAGMNYAVNVEAMEGKDVLGASVIGTEKYLKDLVKDITR